MNLDVLVSEFRNYPGITRKKTISEVIRFFPNLAGTNVLASFGEDSAVIEFNDDSVLLLAADGIMEPLMKANPYYAGYYAVLVNINDISAMGGIPIAMVDVVSMKDEKVCGQVMKGMEVAVRKFGVPIVGGHTHPDCHYNAIDVAILGTASKKAVIYSHTAEIGDDIIFAMDLDGFYPDALPYAWDTTSKKGNELVRKQMLVMNVIGEKGLVHSGKDMSNPGSLGTLGMLLETSGKGGEVVLDNIPRPKDQDFIQWIKAYQGCGFVLTASPEHSESIMKEFADVKVTAAVVGKVNDSSKLMVDHDGRSATLFDFGTDKITGCGPSVVPAYCSRKK